MPRWAVQKAAASVRISLSQTPRLTSMPGRGWRSSSRLWKSGRAWLCSQKLSFGARPYWPTHPSHARPCGCTWTKLSAASAVSPPCFGRWEPRKKPSPFQMQPPPQPHSEYSLLMLCPSSSESTPIS